MKSFERIIVTKNINIDVIDLIDTNPSPTIDELLLTVARPLTRLDFSSIAFAEQTPLMRSVKSFVSKNSKSIDTFTKEGVLTFLQNEWLPILSNTDKLNFLSTGFKMFTIDQSGLIVFDNKYVEIYRDQRNKPYTNVTYHAAGSSSSSSGGAWITIGVGPFQVLYEQCINGKWCVPTMISAEQWYTILKNATEKMKSVVGLYLMMPNNEGSCYQVMKRFGVNSNFVNASNTMLGMRAVKMMGNFRVGDLKDPNRNHYWMIAMNNGHSTEEGFVWQLRPELIAAARKLQNEGLMPDLESMKTCMAQSDSDTDSLLSDSDDEHQIDDSHNHKL